MRKILCFFLVVIILVCLMTLMTNAVMAEESDALPTPESYVEKIAEALPPEMSELLPEGDTYEDMAGNADTDYLLSLSLTFLKKAFSSLTGYLTFFLGVILLGALAVRIESAIGSGDGISSFLVVLMIAFQVFSILYSLFEDVAAYSDSVSHYMLTASGVMSAVTLLGGGAVESTVSGALLTTAVSLLGGFIGSLLLPIIRVSFASSLTGVSQSRVNLTQFASFLRGFFTFLMGFLSMLSVVALTFQTMLAQAEDTLAARSIRFAASSSIPIVGGAVSDSVRTLGAAVSVIKKSVGTVGMAGLLIMTLYPLSSLFSAKLALSLSRTAAGILDVKPAEALLEEAGKLINMMIALVAMLSVLYIFVMALFAGTSVAVG